MTVNRNQLRVVVRDGNEDIDAVPAGGYPLTDLGNGERYSALHGADVRYIGNWDRYYVWDGVYWHHDTTGEVLRRAKLTARSIRDEATTIRESGEDDRATETLKHALRSESGSRIREMVNCARVERAIASTPDVFDTHPLLLTCPNGTVDLRTGELGACRRDDLITKCTSTPYDVTASADLWLSCVERWMGGNERLIAFLQRALGASITGLTGDRVLYFCFGPGANGKSVLIDTIQDIAGDYAKSVRPEALMVKQNNDIPNEVAALVGARFVATTEIEEGSRLAESLVKQLTGGDRISARFLRAEFFEFRPVMKIWMAGNHKPSVRGTDQAIWDRILTIPFTEVIPPEERDPNLRAKLRDEWPGILAWIVQGCLMWQQEGLNPPDDVRAATDEYRREMDALGQFLDDCCEIDDRAIVTAKSLFERWKAWQIEMGEKEMSQKRLGMKLAERGFISDRSDKTRIWQGLDLKSGGSQ